MGRLYPRYQAGFTLIEALVALLVVTIGLLALGGFHVAQSHHADAARLRTEATQLAQAKLEELRSFERIDAAPGRHAYAGMADGNDEPAIASNTRFQREWQLGGSAGDLLRSVEITVRWSDRSGAANAVRLSSMIARADPADSGALAFPPPDNGLLRRIKERSSGVPVAATALDGINRGRSSLRWNGSSGGHLVFDEVQGTVIAHCSSAPTDSTDLQAACLPLSAYLLRGYLSGPWRAAISGVAFTDVEHLLATPECELGAATNQNDGSVISGARAYSCLLRPADHDADPTTPRVWSGRVQLIPTPVEAQRVCRYSGNASTARNEEHPAIYRRVASSLHHQNFTLTDDGLCPAGTVQHQP